METLIEALQIFLKYANPTYPTHCEHDVMYVVAVHKDEDKVSAEDLEKLDKLGFFWSDDEECFMSYRYGSS